MEQPAGQKLGKPETASPPSTHRPPRLLIAASGTGGHVFPALAVAEQLSDWQIDWLGVPDRLENQLVPALYPLETIALSGWQGRPGWRWLRAVGQVLRGVWQLRRRLRSTGTQVVFTTGGYIAAPAILAARSLGIPVILHESNAIPGKVTRWLAPFCTTVALGMAAARPYFRASVAPKLRVVGNPVRGMFQEAQPLQLPIPAGVPLILVVGGSQGARGLNRLVVEAAPQWLAAGAWVVHLTGELEIETVKGAAPDHPHYVALPFWEDMAALWQRATLAVSRSGAMTLAEMAVTETPAILVPYPYAAEDHQYVNGQVFAAAGAAVVYREEALTATQLGELGVAWLRDPAGLAARRAALGQMQVAIAAQTTADLVRQALLGQASQNPSAEP